MAIGGLHSHPAGFREGVDTRIAAEASPATAFDPAKRHLGFVMNGGAVHMADPGLNALSNTPATGGVPGEYCGRQSEFVVIGAGSAIFGLGALSTFMQHPGMKGAELALCDTNVAGLETMHKLAEKMNSAWGSEVKISASSNRRDLLPDADFVIVSIQVGQRETVWQSDWEVPFKHGIRQPYAE